MDFLIHMRNLSVMIDVASDSRAAAFAKAVQWLLRPLVRALIAQGVTALALYQVIKRVYVEVAEEELARAGERPTDSRINVLTGVHRRDIRAFRTSDGSGEAEARRKVTIIATVLGRWLGDAATTDAEGRPLALPRASEGGASFDALVEGVSRDIRPRAVLDELARQGLVAVDADSGLIELRAEAFFGPADLDQRVHFFAANVGDHIAAAAENLLAEAPRFMERAVFYNRLTPASVDAIEKDARRRATELLVDVNRLAHRRQEGDLDAPEGTERFRFGVYFYREDQAGKPETGAADRKDGTE